jgi:hypothetical protein
MAKPDIVVTWTSSAGFSFDPQQYPVKESKKFTIGQADGSTWTFTGATGLPTPPFKVKVTPTLITVDDKLEAPQNYPYAVTIKDSDGKPHDSGNGKKDTTPPIIMNE